MEFKAFLCNPETYKIFLKAEPQLIHLKYQEINATQVLKQFLLTQPLKEIQLFYWYCAQHVPRINGDIPSVDEATSDHQRLLDRYFLYPLVGLDIELEFRCITAFFCSFLFWFLFYGCKSCNICVLVSVCSYHSIRCKVECDLVLHFDMQIFKCK